MPGSLVNLMKEKNWKHICRYISRPSLSEERLSVNDKGQLIYKLKKPYSNGTTHIIFSPLDFLSRLSSLIPRPRTHLTKYHAVFAPHFKYRSLIIPKPKKEEIKENRKSYSMGWAKRLKRVFGIDIQTCSNCGGKIKIISAIEEVHVIQRIHSSGRRLQDTQTLPSQRASRNRGKLYLSVESIFMIINRYCYSSVE